MSTAEEPTPRSAAWKWWVCTILLLATTINYMDRQTLSVASVRITTEFELSNEQYGQLETAFSLAFAVGASLFGFVADRVSVRWLYPTVLVLWSAMGFLTGVVETFSSLLLCRLFLGLFESGHWPCALTTTSRLFEKKHRTLANSILQSGTSIGAIVTPLVMAAILTSEPGSWRPAFKLIGGVGLIWIFLWSGTIRSGDLKAASALADSADAPPLAPPLSRPVFIRRFAVLLVVVAAINICWHIFRAWLPKFLQEGRGFSEQEALYFNSAYFVATDIGCIAAGMATVGLHRLGVTVHRARAAVYGLCAVITSLSTLLMFLPKGWIMMGVLLAIGFGALGLFPCFYSLSQELSARHQGKITGALGTFAWAVTAPLHPLLGWFKDTSGSYDWGLVLAGWMPLLGLAALVLFWGRDDEQPQAP